ncbi:hypothetical protein VPH35_116857 [Triticum aestivum]
MGQRRDCLAPTPSPSLVACFGRPGGSRHPGGPEATSWRMGSCWTETGASLMWRRRSTPRRRRSKPRRKITSRRRSKIWLMPGRSRKLLYWCCSRGMGLLAKLAGGIFRIRLMP